MIYYLYICNGTPLRNEKRKKRENGKRTHTCDVVMSVHINIWLVKQDCGPRRSWSTGCRRMAKVCNYTVVWKNDNEPREHKKDEIVE